MKWLVIVVCLLSFSSHARKSEFFSHTEAADVFTILDNLSEWFPASKREYRVAWQKKFGLSDRDIEKLQLYRSFRLRFKQKSPSSETSMFSELDVPLDIISEAFYTSESVDEALRKLSPKLKKDDILFLAETIKYFKENIKEWYKESIAFKSKVKLLKKNFSKDKVNRVLKDIAKFLGVKKPNINIHMVWWPSANAPVASFYGHHVVLHFNPIDHISNLNNSIVIEAAIAGMLRNLPSSSKESFTKAYFNQCQIQKRFTALSQEQYLERPLILALSHLNHGNQKLKKKFDVFVKWDQNEMVNLLARDFFFYYLQARRSKVSFGTEFANGLGSVCQSYVDAFSQAKKP
ncbi:hypothetical protein HBN50_09520 [Halobacteriovorax sp. GB3]|uniref:hypothetical protein n=1 Tax=Halobacteriovorax sp. GB3 TaxID=2719615 RepID=UPI00235EC637|nr:hypothetical protein [Halobacteriovorax sp. GB3]MDD0853336.1 hypothetical protein [Halobacteriovorax sp. GB3]